MRTAALAERWTLPPIQCQPWCVYQDGAADVIHRADQNSYGEELRIDLRLHSSVDEAPLPGEDFGPGPDHIFVELRQNGHEGDPYIVLRRECGDGPVIEWKFIESACCGR